MVDPAIGRAVRRTVGVVFFVLVVAVVALPLLRCRDSGVQAAADATLPAGLNSLDGLERLHLPAGVSDLGWLPEDLVSLSLAGLDDSLAAQLPAGLRHLEVRGEQAPAGELTDLSALPRTLQTVRFEGSYLRELGEVPPGLLRLRLGRVDELDPGRIPRSTIELGLDSVSMDALWRGLDGLEVLRLSGVGVRGISGIERFQGLGGLSLRETRTDEAKGLPRMLRYLELESNRLARGLEATDLPPFLVELALRDQPLTVAPAAAGGASPLPPSLRVLHLESAKEIPDDLIAALPSGLVELQLAGSGALPLCAAAGSPAPLGSLETLRLSSGIEIDLDCLPPGLEELHLESVDPGNLARIAVPLRGLALRYSFGFDLRAAGFSTETLRFLDLSFSRPGAPVDFAELGSLEHLRFLSSPWSSLPELPASLRVLDLSGSMELRSIAGLDRWCPELEVLRLGGTGVSSLEHLPDSLEELDLRETDRLLSLDGLPPELETLTISAAAFDRLDRLPASLTDLSIVDR